METGNWISVSAFKVDGDPKGRPRVFPDLDINWWRDSDEAEIEAAGFIPSETRLSVDGVNFIPEAVMDHGGLPHLYERKTSGSYSASPRNNIYLAAKYAEKHGMPLTIELQGRARMSKPLERMVLKIQAQFGGEVRRTP